MAITLFDLTYKVAALLGNLREGTATGGSATTVIDTVALADYDDDYFNGGTAWIIDTTDDAVPKGRYALVTNFVKSTKTLTMQTVTDAVASGDTYAVANNRYPLWLLIQRINAVLTELKMPIVDTSSLTTVADQREYTLPAAASLDLREVYLQTILDDSDRNGWQLLYNWDIEYTATGTAEQLILDRDYAAGYDLKLVYGGFHADLRAYSDALNEIVHPDRIVYQAAADCLDWYMDKTRLRDYEQTRDKYLERAKTAALAHPLPPLPPRTGKINLINDPHRTGYTNLSGPDEVYL